MGYNLKPEAQNSMQHFWDKNIFFEFQPADH